MTASSQRQHSVPQTTRGRQLSACIFCGSPDISQEHMVADWAIRTFTRQRKPLLLAAHLDKDNKGRLLPIPPVVSAGVTCRGCNNGWIHALDDAASMLLKPLIRADAEVTLDAGQQRTAAAWMLKTAFICEANEVGEAGPLSDLRPTFMAAIQPPLGCMMLLGSVRAKGPTVVPFGVRPANGTLMLTLNMRDQSGYVRPGQPTAIPIPGFQVMVGALSTFITRNMEPAPIGPMPGFKQIWPISQASVAIAPRDA